MASSHHTLRAAVEILVEVELIIEVPFVQVGQYVGAKTPANKLIIKARRKALNILLIMCSPLVIEYV